MLRTQAMPPTLSVLGNIPILIKSRVPKPRTCVLGTVPQSALLRLPIFLCVQKKKLALLFGIQFRDSGTCFFFPFHLTWAIKVKDWTSIAVKTTLQITFSYGKQPLLLASGINQAPNHTCMHFQYGQHIPESLATPLFPKIAKEEACICT